jgi:hypothetical protein
MHMRFVAELKRRNVFRVGIAYAVTAWVLLQVLDVVGEILELPAWGGKLILAIIVAGFFVTLFVAWAFELTPEGIKRESEVKRSESVTTQTGRKLDRVIIGFLVIAVVILLGDRLIRIPSIQEATKPGERASQTSAAEDLDAARNSLGKSIAVLPLVNNSYKAGDDKQEVSVTVPAGTKSSRLEYRVTRRSKHHFCYYQRPQVSSRNVNTLPERIGSQKNRIRRITEHFQCPVGTEFKL